MDETLPTIHWVVTRLKGFIIDPNDETALDGDMPIGRVFLRRGDHSRSCQWLWTMYATGWHAELQPTNGVERSKGAAKSAVTRSFCSHISLRPSNVAAMREHYATVMRSTKLREMREDTQQQHERPL